MNLTIDQVANDLALAHRAADPKTTIIKHFETNHQDEIHLLEVSASAPNSGEVLPFRFAPDPANGVPYPSVVILLSPDEWQMVEDGQLLLPHDWDLTKGKDI